MNNVSLHLLVIDTHTHTHTQMYGLYKDPEGNQVFERSSDNDFTTQHTRTTTYFSSDPESLRKRIAELEAQLAARGQVGRLYTKLCKATNDIVIPVVS